jgi:hypothetical protein
MGSRRATATIRTGSDGTGYGAHRKRYNKTAAYKPISRRSMDSIFDDAHIEIDLHSRIRLFPPFVSQGVPPNRAERFGDNVALHNLE